MKKKVIRFLFTFNLLGFVFLLNAQVVWEEQFDGSLNGWEVEAIMDTVTWKWSSDGDISNGAFAGNAAINSPSSANGAAILNYDFEMTGGDSGNAPDFPYPDVIVDLISPIIDLSAEEGHYGLEFYQLIRLLNNAPQAFFSSFSLSRDGGVTWEAPTDANPTVQPNDNPFNGRSYFPISNVAGEDSLRIKFTYAGDFYYWVLDDIAIVRRVDNDMQANENFFAIPNNYSTPLSQIEPIFFLSDIQNVGGTEQEEVTLTVNIERGNEEVFNAVLDYGTIGVDSLAENVIFEDSFIPDEKGVYSGSYTVNSSVEDDRPGNNVLEFKFEIGDTTFAKESGSTRSIAPADSDSYNYGNVFYVPNGDGWFARFVSFQVNNASDLEGRTVTTYVYKWDGAGADAGEIDVATQLEVLGFNSYTFNGNEQGLITIPAELDGEPIELEDDAYYIVTVEYLTDDTQACFLAASEDYNYGANIFIADSLDMERYANALDVGATGTLGLVGFGFNIVPVIRLHIGDNPNLDQAAITEVSTIDPLPAENLVDIFPNPAKEQLSLILHLTEVSNKVSVKFFDSKGRLLRQNKYENLKQETLNYNIKNLAPGTYFLQLVTDLGVRIKRFVVY